MPKKKDDDTEWVPKLKDAATTWLHKVYQYDKEQPYTGHPSPEDEQLDLPLIPPKK